MNGQKGHNDNLTKFTSAITVGQTVTMELDRVKGTLSIKVDGEDRGPAFTEDFFKTGTLFFCASLHGYFGPSSWQLLR